MYFSNDQPLKILNFRQIVHVCAGLCLGSLTWETLTSPWVFKVQSWCSKGRIQGEHDHQSCLSQVKLLQTIFTHVVAGKILPGYQSHNLHIQSTGNSKLITLLGMSNILNDMAHFDWYNKLLIISVLLQITGKWSIFKFLQ